MAAYNFRERKLVLGGDQAVNAANIQKYLEDEDYYKLTSESGLQRQLYLNEKLADYIANPEHAAQQHRNKLQEIEKDTKIPKLRKTILLYIKKIHPDHQNVE